MRADLPRDELLRLARLSELQILDSLTEDSFDAVVETTAELLEVETVILGFIDQNRHWFKSKKGVDLVENSRDYAFCAHTILVGDVVVAPDTLLDERFADNPFVLGGPRFRFYAGVPVTFQGQPVGTICCFGPHPRKLSEREIKILTAMAAQVNGLLECRAVTIRLDQAESRFTSSIDSMYEGVIIWNSECEIVHANGRAAAILGVVSPELLGNGSKPTCLESLFGRREWTDPEANPVAAALFQGMPQIGKTFELAGDGESGPKAISFNCLPLFRNEESKPYGVVSTLTDVTRRTRARAALKETNAELENQVLERTHELAQFFSVSIDMLCISNSDGYLTRVSPAFTESLGWTEEELCSRPAISFVHPDDLGKSGAEVFEFRGEGVRRQFEHRFQHRDGSYRTLWWKSVQFREGLAYSVARDITEQREMEAELRLAVEQARKADMAKSEFLSRMSHELRTPMNAVLGYAQLLDLKYEDPSIKSATASILRGGNHLLQLINQVLDISKVEAGNFGISMEPVSFFEVVEEALSLLRPSAEAMRVRILVAKHGREDCQVMVDRQRLLQILLNLIGNAIKYNREGGNVTIRSVKAANTKWRFEIEDSGTGIPSDARELLFQPFHRFTDPGIEGSGLGLAISKRFSLLMGGDVGLSHSDEKGSTFFVELIRASHADRPPEQVSDHGKVNLPNLNGGTILYIEDNISNIRLIESILEDWTGITMIPATRARLGLEIARTRQPDLILLDMHLPDLGGDKVLEQLKSDPLTKHIPVVVLSADATQRQIESAIWAGAEEYLTKPIDLGKLHSVFGQILPGSIPAHVSTPGQPANRSPKDPGTRVIDQGTSPFQTI